MNYLLAPNPTSDEALDFSIRLTHEIEAAGERVLVSPEAASKRKEMSCWQGEQIDRIIVLGGDGTILRQFHAMPGFEAPVWGINFGHLGYLTDCEPDQAMQLLPKILSGEYHIESRTMIDGCLVRDGQTMVCFKGLNEACIHRGAMNHAVRVALSLNGVLLRTIVADGLLLATATGSTAYNYSAGGPLLTPEAEGLVITPICARWAENTPVVTAAHDCIEAVVSMTQRADQEEDVPRLMIDGYKQYELQEGDRVVVRGAQEKLKMIRTETGSFCERLSRKMALMQRNT